MYGMYVEHVFSGPSMQRALKGLKTSGGSDADTTVIISIGLIT